MLGLLSAEPRDFSIGQRIDVRLLLDNNTPLRAIITDRQESRIGTIANRVIYASKSGRSLRREIISAPPDVELAI